MLNDEPAVIDGLARAALVRSVGDRIHACHPPQVFGISGDWGSGKTSFLRQLQRYVTGKCGVVPSWKRTIEPCHLSPDRAVVVWFEAWRYQHEERPVVALLHEIRQQLSVAQKALGKGKKYAEVVARGALTIFDESTKQIGVTGLSKIQDIGEKYEAQRYETLLGVEDIRRHLQDAIDKLLWNGFDRGPRRRLVVLIDDLDRCHPQAATKLLEGLKIFLNLENCVFVLGMNQAIVEQGIALAYKDLPVDHRAVAHEYLEKICGNIWHLPFPDPENTFLRSTLTTMEGATPLAATADARREFFGEIARIDEEEAYISPVPRRVKMYANLFERMFEHHSHRYQDEEIERNARIAILFGTLYLGDQRPYRILQTQPGFYKEVLLPWAKNPTSVHESHYPFLPRPGSATAAALSNDQTATPTAGAMFASYRDPGDAGLLRIRPLILTLDELTNSEIRRYLLQ